MTCHYVKCKARMCMACVSLSSAPTCELCGLVSTSLVSGDLGPTINASVLEHPFIINYSFITEAEHCMLCTAHIAFQWQSSSGNSSGQNNFISSCNDKF